LPSQHVNRRLTACIAALAFALCSQGANVAADRSKAVTHTVTIDASRFEPRVLIVKAGDTVMWVNKDIISHTATSQRAGFGSGEIAPGGSWTYRPKQAGEFAYICTFHPTMTGTIRVR
jgi:plastocyanin